MAQGQYLQLTHTTASDAGQRISTPVVLVDSTSDPVTAAVATHIAADAPLGIITLGGAHPQIAALPANRTINVNTTADSATLNTAGCSNGAGPRTLRSAIAVANNDYATTGISKADTINLPAGTYTLSA